MKIILFILTAAVLYGFQAYDGGPLTFQKGAFLVLIGLGVFALEFGLFYLFNKKTKNDEDL